MGPEMPGMMPNNMDNNMMQVSPMNGNSYISRTIYIYLSGHTTRPLVRRILKPDGQAMRNAERDPTIPAQGCHPLQANARRTPMGLFPQMGSPHKSLENYSNFVDIDIDEQYYRLQFRWAGHLARLPEWRGDRLGTRLLRFRDTHWLKRCVAQHGHQGHVGRFRVWRWEQSISKFCGTLWQDKARDKVAWEETAKAGAKWRKCVRN